ncbi:MAG: hypothetical protein M3Y13_03205, partial [Armatimonadota bacterium]|nr:hypothetical protein [Armatimonadota bacterium]
MRSAIFQNSRSRTSQGRLRRFRSRAACLALLWAVNVLLGPAWLCAAARGASVPKACAVTPPPMPSCHCRMCWGVMQGGRRVCCCHTVHPSFLVNAYFLFGLSDSQVSAPAGTIYV